MSSKTHPPTLHLLRPLPPLQSVLPAASAPLSATTENLSGWRSVQLDPSEPGSSSLVRRLESYALAFVTSANVDYVESHPPTFDAERREMLVHVRADAVDMSIMKVMQGEKKTKHSTCSYYYLYL